MKRLVTAAEMRRFDEETIEGIGVPGVVLMENAGRAVVDAIAKRRPSLAHAVVAVVCGPGNNGGDGYVVARLLHERGADVTVVRAAASDKILGDARVHHDAAVHSGVRFVDGTAEGFHPDGAEALAHAEVVVDALLGTGTTRTVQGHFAELVYWMNQSRGLRVAVDLPSGLDADRGVALGTCVHADVTVTFAFAKAGLVSAPGFLHVGELIVADIGIPARLAADVKAVLLDDECLAPLRAPRPRDAHKGTFGHLLVVAGSGGKTGAALLCGNAAIRAGAGLVTVASPDEAQRALAARVVEVMTEPLGPEPLDGDAAWARLEPLVVGKRAVAFGPGVGRAPGVRRLLARLLDGYAGAIVVDADGLNALAEDPGVLDGRARGRVVLTPHPAEMARLAGVHTAAVQADRIGTARRFAEAHEVVVALKGARTVVAAPDGLMAINPTGNPGLGSGGTGDVLTGVVGALLAGGMPPFEAACAAAYLHGRAGDLAVEKRGGEAGLVASDVIDALASARYGGQATGR